MEEVQVSVNATWYTLDEVGHHGAKVSSNVLKDLCIFVVLGFQEHPGEIHVLQEQRAHGEGVALQRAARAVEIRGRWTVRQPKAEVATSGDPGVTTCCELTCR